MLQVLYHEEDGFTITREGPGLSRVPSSSSQPVLYDSWQERNQSLVYIETNTMAGLLVSWTANLSTDRDRTENFQGRLHLPMRFVHTHCLHIDHRMSVTWTEGLRHLGKERRSEMGPL